jgi:hypothetical protein
MSNLARTSICLASALLVMTSASASAAPRPWIEVAGGQRGDFSWSVEAKRPGGPAGIGKLGAWRPCLQVVTTWWKGPYSYDRTKYRSCTGATGRLSPTEAPLIASGVKPTNPRQAGLSIVGMVFAPRVSSVRVTFAGGSSRTLALRRLTQPQARATGLGRLRYAAFLVRGTWCAERLISLNSSGRALWDSGTNEYDCPTTHPGNLLS